MLIYRVKNLYVGQLVFVSPKLNSDNTIKFSKTNNYIIYSRKRIKDNTFLACDIITNEKYEPYFKNGVKKIKEGAIYSYSVLEIKPVLYNKPFITKKNLLKIQSNIEKEYLHKSKTRDNKVKIYNINSKS